MASSERRHPRSFSRQFKAETVALIRSSGKSVPQVCRDLDLAESVVRRWLAQAEIDEGSRQDRPFAGDDEVAVEEEGGADPDREPVDGGDDRLVDRRQRFQESAAYYYAGA